MYFSIMVNFPNIIFFCLIIVFKCLLHYYHIFAREDGEIQYLSTSENFLILKRVFHVITSLLDPLYILKWYLY